MPALPEARGFRVFDRHYSKTERVDTTYEEDDLDDDE